MTQDLLAILLVVASIITVPSVVFTLLSRSAADAKLMDADKVTKVIREGTVRARAEAARVVAERIPNGVDPETFVTALERTGGTSVSLQHRGPQDPLVETLVRGYHEQALQQATLQHWFSIAAAVVGFLFILYCAYASGADTMSKVLSVLPGALIEVVAVLFLRQAEQTRARATDLYDRLRKDSLAERSLSLVNTIADEKLRSAVQAQLALHMAGLEPKPIDFGAFLSPSARIEEAVSAVPKG